MTDERTLKRIGKNLRPLPVQLIEQLILDATGESSGKASGESGRACLGAEKSLAMVGARTRLLTGKEDGSHLHAGCAEGECRNDAPCVGDAPGGHHRQLHGVYNL